MRAEEAPVAVEGVACEEAAAALANCETVCAAVAAAEGFPTELRSHLAVAAKSCLLQPREVRHSSQTWVVAMVGQVLEELREKKGAALAAMKANVDGADAEKAARDEACEAAIASADENRRLEAEAKEAFERASQELATALKTLKEAEAGLQEDEADVAKQWDRKNTLESAFASFSALKVGEASGKSRLIKTVLKVGKACAFDSQLLVSAPASLEQGPSERTGFDGLVLGMLEKEFNQAIAQAGSDLASGEPGRELQKELADAVRAQHHFACEKLQECRHQVDSAVQALRAADLEQRRAQKAAKSFDKELATVVAALGLASEEFDAVENALAFYKELEALPLPGAASDQAAPAETEAEVLEASQAGANQASEVEAPASTAMVEAAADEASETEVQALGPDAAESVCREEEVALEAADAPVCIPKVSADVCAGTGASLVAGAGGA